MTLPHTIPDPDLLPEIDYALVVDCPLCGALHAEMFCPPVTEPSRPEVRRG